ncbi:MAG: glycosyltransferase [Chloroflexi bacterium]|nr:glycosyltransferase [Chloroflexota bacterium]
MLFSLTYYRPHVSGLTIYVQRVAETLVRRGHQVTVLTSQYVPQLPREEVLHGVRIVRVPIVARMSKGVIMPLYVPIACRLLRSHDVAVGNLPSTPLEAVGLPLLGKEAGRPVVMTYHCDVQLPPGIANRAVDEGVFWSNILGINTATRVVSYTEDYATHSRVIRRFPQKRVIIPPPVAMPVPASAQVAQFRTRFDLEGRPVVGFVARFATEKGVEYAIEALALLIDRFPKLKMLFVGEHRNVIGEEAYWKRMQPLLREFREHWAFTGVLDPADPAQLASLYAACTVTILPSINSTESFGLVQVESMLCGTPVVAVDLPGVRQPVLITGMGKIVPPRNARALASAIAAILTDPTPFLRPRSAIEEHFSSERTAACYEQLLEELTGSAPRQRSLASSAPISRTLSRHEPPATRERADVQTAPGPAEIGGSGPSHA